MAYRYVIPETEKRFEHEIIAVFLIIALLFLVSGIGQSYLISLIFLLFTVIMVLSDLQEILLLRYTEGDRSLVSLLLAPGTIVHEMSHMSAAVLAGAHITESKLFQVDPGTGTIGYVRYAITKNIWLPLRKILIAMAPFFGCGLVAWFIFSQVIQIPQVVVQGGFSVVLSSLISYLFAFMSDLLSADLLNPFNLILIIFGLSVANGAAPSTTDFRGTLSELDFFSLIPILLFMAVLLLFSDILSTVIGAILGILTVTVATYILSISLLYVLVLAFGR